MRKKGIEFKWKAPEKGSGCVEFRWVFFIVNSKNFVTKINQLYRNPSWETRFWGFSLSMFSSLTYFIIWSLSLWLIQFKFKTLVLLVFTFPIERFWTNFILLLKYIAPGFNEKYYEASWWYIEVNLNLTDRIMSVSNSILTCIFTHTMTPYYPIFICKKQKYSVEVLLLFKCLTDAAIHLDNSHRHSHGTEILLTCPTVSFVWLDMPPCCIVWASNYGNIYFNECQQPFLD